MDIIKIKMMKDLLSMTDDYMKQLTISNPSIVANVDKDEYSNWIKNRISIYIDNSTISFSKDKGSASRASKASKASEKCTARLWNGGQGEKQCTHDKSSDQYCEKHKKMLNEEGVLRFGDMRDPRPSHDLIKKKNNITEKLHWIDSDPLNQLQGVLDMQCKKVVCCAPRLIVN